MVYFPKPGVAAYWNLNIALINLLMKSITPHHAGLITLEEENVKYFHTLKKYNTVQLKPMSR